MKKALKILGIGAAALIGLVLVGFGGASMQASSRLDRTFETHRVSLPVPTPLDAEETAAVRAERPNVTDAELIELARERAIARGKHLVEARYGCNGCHGLDFGGGEMIDDPAIGHILGPNITTGTGSRTLKYTIADWDRIVRHGVKPDGKPAVMPSDDFFKMSDRELSDVVAFITSRPAVNRAVDAPTFGPVGQVLVALGKFPLSAYGHPDHERAHADAPPTTADNTEFGEHLAGICTGCHRANLAGGPMTFGPPDWPASGNLTPHADGLGSWSFDDFERSLTQGVSKDGRTLLPPMSLIIAQTKAMTELERRALWTYFKSLPPTATNR